MLLPAFIPSIALSLSVFVGCEEDKTTSDSIDSGNAGTPDSGDLDDSGQGFMDDTGGDDCGDAPILTWYEDSDSDGFGNLNVTASDCNQPTGFVEDSSDCHDDDPTAYPESHAFETPFDGVDQDCDGLDWCVDLSCDGWTDFLFGSYFDGDSFNAESIIYFGDSTGWSPDQALSLESLGVYDTDVHDLNGDGYLDVLLTHYTSDGDESETSAYVYWGGLNGHLLEDRSELPAPNPLTACIGDFNGDEHDDIAFPSFAANGETWLYWGNEETFAETTTVLESSRVFACTTEDLNQDGLDDLVLSNSYATSADTDSFIYWGSVSGLSESNRSDLPTLGTRHHTIEDIDGDGWSDVLFLNYADADDHNIDSIIYWNDGTGAFDIEDTTKIPGRGALSAAIVDLNGDAAPDIVLANEYSNTGEETTNSYVYWNDGSGDFSSGDMTELPTEGTRQVIAEDFDGDGWEDLLFVNFFDGTDYSISAFLYWNDAGSFNEANRTDLDTNGANTASVWDLDNNGHRDLVFNSYYNGDTYMLDALLYFNPGDATTSQWEEEILPTMGSWATPIIVGRQ